MTRLFLRALNAPALVILAALGVALQTSLFATWPLQYLEPDLVLLVVVWCGLHRDFTEGGILTLIIAELAELHSAAPQGHFLILYMSIYLLIRGASRILVLPGVSSLVLLTIAVSLYFKFASLLLLKALGSPAIPWKKTLLLALPTATIEGLAGGWVFKWLEHFDIVTFKDPRAEREYRADTLIEDME
jgi:hypothetical protein